MMKILILALLLPILSSQAAELKIEPVYGFERNLRAYPKPSRYKTENFLGLRLKYGVQALSFEFEVNQAQSSESFTDTNEEVDYKTESVLTGLRFTPLRTKVISIFGRLGARAKRQTTTVDKGGASTTETSPINLDPYAGTGLSINIINVFSLNAGVTLIYNRDAEESEKYDSRVTFGVTFRAGNK